MRPAHVTAAKLSGPAGRRSTVAPAPPRELRPLSRLQRPPSQHRPLQPCGHASVSSPCDHWPPRPPLTPRCPSLRLARVRRGAPWRRWAGPLRAGAGAGGRAGLGRVPAGLALRCLARPGPAAKRDPGGPGDPVPKGSELRPEPARVGRPGGVPRARACGLHGSCCCAESCPGLPAWPSPTAGCDVCSAARSLAQNVNRPWGSMQACGHAGSPGKGFWGAPGVRVSCAPSPSAPLGHWLR